MQVQIENSYVSSYALIGSIVGGIEAPDPPDVAHFEAHFQAYRLRDGTLEYDTEKKTELERKALCDELRPPFPASQGSLRICCTSCPQWILPWCRSALPPGCRLPYGRAL